MLDKLLFNIYDKKSDTFMASPMSTSTVAEIVRQLQTEAKKMDSMYALYPKDFNLVICGEYSPNTGVFVMYEDVHPNYQEINLATFISTPKESENLVDIDLGRDD